MVLRATAMAPELSPFCSLRSPMDCAQPFGLRLEKVRDWLRAEPLRAGANRRDARSLLSNGMERDLSAPDWQRLQAGVLQWPQWPLWGRTGAA